jgi:hypothetical protein
MAAVCFTAGETGPRGARGCSECAAIVLSLDVKTV